LKAVNLHGTLWVSFGAVYYYGFAYPLAAAIYLSEYEKNRNLLKPLIELLAEFRLLLFMVLDW
jgi:ABC-type phosphate transport system permease subunit